MSGPVTVDIRSCDRELVQFSQAIQPYGFLLAVEDQGARITEASANTQEFLNLSAGHVLNASLRTVLGAEHAHWIAERANELKAGATPRFLGQIEIGRFVFEVFAHRLNGKLILEFEQSLAESGDAASFYGEVRSCMAELQLAEGVEGFLDVATRTVRKLTGFDRVVTYKFLADGTGHILAESRGDEMSSLLGLHFPPSDVPVPARRVLSLVWVRHQPDIGYTPVPLHSNDPMASPLDLSYSNLRSTSAMCNRYYLNMGVKAKLVVALLQEGELWGIINCHHQTPKYVSYETRMACETIAHTLSLLLRTKESALAADEGAKVRQRVEAAIELVSAAPSWEAELASRLVDCLPSGGAAVSINGDVLLRGTTPAERDVRTLTKWLEGRERTESVFASHALSSRFPEAFAYRDSASGLLAARLGQNEYLLWFRPEVKYELTWAGDPQKPVEMDERDGTLRLAPRTSFEMQRGVLNGLSEPWKPYEVEAALSLARAASSIRNTDELSRSVDSLRASNDELESFAYTASHDLREPLRGIRTYSQMLARRIRSDIGEPELRRLETIERLAGRMDELLESLLQCSRVGRIDARREITDLNALLQQAIETIQHQLSGATVRTLGALPKVICDPSQIQQVFVNLIVNGLKYNSSAQKVIEIGVREEPEPTIFVRDNGIGIPEKHHQDVFQIFRRLHGQNDFGGGSGAGLTIVKKIVEHHGGKIWLESAPSQGSTFYFTLPDSIV